MSQPPLSPHFSGGSFCNSKKILHAGSFPRCAPHGIQHGKCFIGRGDIITQERYVPFQEIVRIQEAEAEALAEIERARREADARLNRAREEVPGAVMDAREKAAAEVAAMIAAAEGEAAAEAERILSRGQEKKRAIIGATASRLDEAVAMVVQEVTGNVPDRPDG